MFLTEEDLKQTFWKNYNYSKRALIWQFEAPIRTGGVDLLTLEKFQGKYQINAFEFKLNDIKKVLLQAKENIKFCNKSWIVVPSEKKKTVLERYQNFLAESKYIGVICVDEGGKWEMVYRPNFQKEFPVSQEFLDFLLLHR